MPYNPLNLLPDWKGALNTFYEEKIKTTLDEKSREYKALFTAKFTQFNHDNKQFQNSVLIILASGLVVLTIAHFWPQ